MSAKIEQLDRRVTILTELLKTETRPELVTDYEYQLQKATAELYNAINEEAQNEATKTT